MSLEPYSAFSFAQRLEAALKTAHAGGPVDIPKPQTREELLVLIQALGQETKHLGALVDRTFCADAAPVDVSAMSLDEKIQAGEQACKQLSHVTLGLPEQLRLERLEASLANDEASRSVADRLLAKARA
jgi:hypothetical protein